MKKKKKEKLEKLIKIYLNGDIFEKMEDAKQENSDGVVNKFGFHIDYDVNNKEIKSINISGEYIDYFYNKVL
jgi:hypothetical protein